MSFAATTQALLAQDGLLPQRDLMLDAGRMSERLAAGLSKNGKVSFEDCKIARVKYRFGENLRVLYDIKFKEQYIKIASRTLSPERAAKVFEELRMTKNTGGALLRGFFDEDLEAIFLTFPNDRKIKHLPALSKPPRGLAVQVPGWTSSRVVAYAPEKCATAQCLDTNGSVLAYAKVFASDEGRDFFYLYKNLYDRKNNVPCPIAYSEKYKVLILEAISGELLASRHPGECSTIYHEFGKEIGRLHETESFFVSRSSRKLTPERMARILDCVKNVRPDVGRQAKSVVAAIADQFVDAETQVLLHGDVHDKNIIWRDDSATLIDLDQAYFGDPATDIGSFLAGLHYKECTGQMVTKTRHDITESFLAGYRSVRSLPNARSLRWHTAATLFSERVSRAIHRVRVSGLERLPDVLQRCKEILV